MTPTEYTGVHAGVSLAEAETSPAAIRLLANPGGVQVGGSGEYFLLENRQNVGFDSKLPGCGTLIWHIDETRTTNRLEGHRLVQLEQADGLGSMDIVPQNGNRGDAGDPYPGSAVNRLFDAITAPSAHLNSGAASGVSVGVPGGCGSMMTLNLGAPGANPTPTTLALASSLNPSVVDEGVTYTATVSPGPDGGTVAFLDGTDGIPGCAAQPLSGGDATCTVTYAAPGSHAIGATYSGSSSFAGSSSPTISQVVNEAAPTYTLSGTFSAGGVAQAGGILNAFNATTSAYLATAIADGSGHYSFSLPPAPAPDGYRLYVGAVSPGYPNQWFGGGGLTFAGATTIPLAGPTVQDVALAAAPTYTLSGTFSAGGVAQAGGILNAFNATTSAYLATAIADGSGHYSFSLPPAPAPDGYRLYVGAVSPGYPNQWFGGGGLTFAGATTIPLAGPTVQDVALAAAPTYTLSGTFSAGGVTQAGGILNAFNATTSAYLATAIADGSGHYSFSLPPAPAPDGYRLYVGAVSPGYPNQWFGGGGLTFAGATTIPLAGPTVQDVALAAAPTYTLSGTFSAGGVTQAGGILNAFNATTSAYLATAIADGSGHYSFSLPPAPAPDGYRLYVGAVSPGYPNQWFGGGGLTFAGATTIPLAGPTVQDVALP